MSETAPAADAGKLPISVIARIVMAALIVSAISIFLGYTWLAGKTSRAIDHVVLGTLLAGPLLAVIGLVRRTSWGRWFGLGTSFAGLSILGAVVLVQRHRLEGLTDWRLLATAGGFLLLGLCLVGRTMAEQFEFRANSRGAWQGLRRERQARVLNLVPILALSATPMLVSVMTGLGGSVARSVLAGVALLVTATGVGLLLAQRTAGMLLLIAAGVINAVLAVQMISATNLYFLTSVMWTMGYALIPAAIGGLLGIVALARPVVRSLRS